jgi:hypothetical protein
MPLRAKIAAEVLDPQTPPDDTTGSRRVLRLLVDVKDIVMNVDPTAFQEPQGMKRVSGEELVKNCPKVKEQAAAAVKTLWDLSANAK